MPVLPLRSAAVAGSKYAGKGACTRYRFEGHPGLVLQVGRPRADGTSARTFYYIAHHRGSRSYQPLGRWPDLTLPAAVAKAAEMRAAVRSGADITAKEEHANEGTIAELVECYLAAEVHGADPPKRTANEIDRMLTRYVLPRIGERQVGDVKRKDIAQMRLCISVHGTKVPDSRAKPPIAPGPKRRQADRVVRALSQTFLYGVDNGLAEFDPASRMRAMASKKSRDRFLSLDEIAVVWPALETLFADSRADIVRIILLTGVRKSEALKAERGEFSPDANEPRWIIPASRSKSGREHVVPLCATAQRIVRAQLAKMTSSSPYLFPSPVTDGAYDATALNNPLRRALRTGALSMQYFTIHDLRRTVGKGLEAIGISQRDIGLVLGHAVGTDSGAAQVTATYTPADVASRSRDFRTKRDALGLWDVMLTDTVFPSPERKLAQRRVGLKVVSGDKGD